MVCLPYRLRYQKLNNTSKVFTETPEIAADMIVYLTAEKRAWLAGRHINCTWDTREFMSIKDEIVKLVIKMSFQGRREIKGFQACILDVVDRGFRSL